MFSLYRNPDLDDQIFYCLLTSMAVVQADDVHACFLFVSNLISHHQELLGSTATNRHGVAAFSCREVGPTHVRGRTLDLLMIDIPDLVPVAVVAPMVTQITPFCEVISMAQDVPNLYVSRKVFPKHQVNWNWIVSRPNIVPGQSL